MKKAYLLLFLLCMGVKAFSQISVSCATGTGPTLSAGWALSGTAAVSGSAIQLAGPSPSQGGALYYNTSLNVTGCGAFTVDFDFQIIPSASSYAIADGISFFFVNPLTGFIGGGGIGLPTNPNGLVLILDTYDNDGVPNDPLISLYGYPSGFVGTYTEGTPTNRLGFLNNQNFIDDGGWHHAKVTYSGGTVRVYFNYSAVPSITNNFPITTPGYFGFTSSTGAAYSTQSVRNVYINSNTISPIVGPSVLCLGNPATYTDATAGGTWTSSNPGVATVVAATGVVTPVGPGVTTLTYAYSSSCLTTFNVTVDASALSPITGPTSVCPGTPATLANAAAGGTWSSSSTTTATIGATTGIVNGVLGGTTTITYTLPVGCYNTRSLTVNNAPAPITITPTPATVCDNGSLTLTSTYPTANTLIPGEGWENGVPTTAGTPIDQWNYIGATPSYWYQMPGNLTTSPTTGTAYAGNYVADFNCRSLPAGSTAALYSPSFSMVGAGTATLSFWMYRDVSAYNTVGYNTEGVTVYVNTTPAVGGTNLGFVPRRGGAPITGSLTGTSTPATSGWQQYTATIPATFTGATNYIVFSALSQNGNNIYLDSVTVTGSMPPPTWTPTTYLFNDAGFTVPYTGASLNPVYMHPTGISAVSSITYSVSVSNGTCTTTGTNTVVMNPNPAAITGPTTTCVGASTTYASATTGGTWTSSNTSIATINPSTGVATALTPGVVTFTYCFGSCCTSISVTVVASPGANAGVTIACQGLTTTLSNATGGGSWSSSAPTIGTVGSLTGVVTGIALGTTVITYGIATCYSTTVVTVNPVPTPITGSLTLCVGSTSALGSTPASGIWTSSAGTIATVGVTSGIATGVAIGTATISYRVAGCAATATITVVNTTGPITGPSSVCIGSTITAGAPTSGGTWSSGCPTILSINPTTGVITGIGAGTCNITYSLSAGCYNTSTITVTGVPTSIGGTMTMCVGGTTTLNHATAGGTWSTTSSNASVALGTGVVTGLLSGTAVITYTLPSGCTTTTVVTVNPLPTAITGTMLFCQGATSTLSSSPTGGTWSCVCPGIATVNSSTGTVSGTGGGNCNIVYTTTDGCSTSATVTVSPLPGPITGPLSVCVGGNTALASSPAGGAWISSNLAVGTISGTGVLSGLTPGTTTIRYVLASGCEVSAIASVNPSPATISGPTGLCVGNCTTLTTSSTGGVWSTSNPGVASVSGGLVCGVAFGTSTISYTLSGCSSSVVVSVNSLPAPITGTMTVCVGSSTLLSSATGGGTWSSVSPAVGTVDGVGNVTGISGYNTTTIIYSLGSGCTVSAIVTVNPLPGNITGIMTLCSGSTTTLSCLPGGGTWSSSSSPVASVGIGTGIVTGGIPGTAIITYTAAPSGCQQTAVVTVNAIPSAITGGTSICVGNTTTLSSTPTGGTWLSVNTAAGTVGASTGVVYGVAGGTTTVSYTAPSTGCKTSVVVLVNTLPSAITGTLAVCQGSTTALSSSPGGGTWSSGNTAIATVASGTGLVSGISATPPPGTALITYTLPTTCFTTATVTVNSLPAAITGNASLCVGLTTTLNTVTAGCTWSSSNNIIASVGSNTGIVTGNSAGNANIICRNTTTGCQRLITVTVNALPGTITGIPIVCVGSTTALSCTPAGGTWSVSNAAVASISATGVVTGITANTIFVTYTVGTGCISTTTVTVNPLPTPITGVLTFSEGGTTTLNSTPAGGSWTSGNTSVAIINPSTGVITSPSCGTANITYTLSTGCRASVTVTSNCLPGVITGIRQVCVGLTTDLHCSPTGGTWTSGNTAVGTINPSTGVVTGIAAGTTNITYTLPTLTQQYAVVTVNPLPTPISGTVTLCQGSTTTLSSGPATGTWSSSDNTIGSVNSSTGVVSGIAPGAATISYTLSTGCYATQNVVVNQLPAAITGTLTVCEGLTTTLSSATPGGVTWSSGSANASVGLSSGIVTGVSAGTAIITCYTINNCTATATVSVNALPATITGNLNVCEGFTTTLSTTSTGGTWTSGSGSVASISATGVVLGIVSGTSVITYTLPSTGCIRTAIVTVNPNPSPITGSSGFCNFSSTTMSSTTSGLTWTVTDPTIATIDPITGLITGAAVGTTTVVATTAAGCKSYKNVEVILAPSPISGPHNVCIGQSIMLGNIIPGGTWSANTSSYATVNIATGEVSGIANGVTTITYVLSSNGCYSTYEVTTNPNPSAITGTLGACEGGTTALSSSTGGGTWSSSNTAVGTVDAVSGLVTALSGGVTIISYSLPTGCFTTASVSINPLPSPITGSLNVCEGSTTALSSATAGGAWGSSAPGIAYVSSTGLVTGMSEGTAVISYILGSGCSLSVIVTVSPLPQNITGTMNACQNDSALLSDATPGGVWVSADPAIATVSSDGWVTGHNAGTVAISYMLPTSCASVIIFTVNGIPAAISGSLAVCAGFATNLTSATPDGTWSADPSGAGIATINHITGVVTGITPGTINVTYTLGTGCNISTVVTVIVLPAVISGTPQVCVNGITVLSNPIPGGTWSASNGNALVDAAGIVTGVTAGEVVITYTVGTGCFNVMHVTVNPLPAAITGPSQVCVGSTITLADATPGGIWLPGSTTVATVGYLSGVVTGVSANTTIITYSLVTGCIATHIVTVNATPPAITGSGYICTGSAVSLGNGMPGGVWSSSNTAVATISSTGVVTPVSLGTSIISYIMPLTGCNASRVVTVTPLPITYNVFGGGSYCSGGNGVHVKLDGSQIGVSYVLYYGSSATGFVAGTGDTLDFGLLTLPGTYSVQATYGSSGCQKNMNGSVSVIVTPLTPPAVGIIAVGGDSTCPGTSVTLNPDPTNGGTSPTYLWKVNGVSVSTANSYTFVPADEDVVTVTMISNGSCLMGNTATGTKTLRVLPTAVPMVSVSADPGDTICQYSLTNFTANADYGGTSPAYTWIVNGTTVGAGSSYAFVPEQGDVVAVQMVSNYLCRLATTVTSSNLVMTVDSMIVPHVSIIADPSLSVTEGDSVTLHTIVTNAGPNPVYQWKINGYPVPGATKDTFRSVFHDYDSINCVVTSSGVCHNISTFDWVFISVAPLGVQNTGTGITAIRLVPNPNKGIFTIKGTLASSMDDELGVEVTDMLGQIVYTGKISTHKGKVDTQIMLNNTLANGMYLLNLHSEKEHVVLHFVMEQ